MAQHQSAAAADPVGSAAAADGAAEGLLDRDLLAELAGDFGAEMLDELRLSLDQEGRQGLAAVAEAVGAGDAGDAAAQLHAVRGAGLSVGCAAFGAEAGRLELAAKSGVLPGAGELAALGQLFERSLAAFAAYAAEAGD